MKAPHLIDLPVPLGTRVYPVFYSGSYAGWAVHPPVTVSGYRVTLRAAGPLASDCTVIALVARDGRGSPSGAVAVEQEFTAHACFATEDEARRFADQLNAGERT